MKTKLEFENTLYDEETPTKWFEIIDPDFWSDRKVLLPALRPFLLNKAV